MNEDELNGLKKALDTLDWFYKWYGSREDLSEDFLNGFAQAKNILYYEIELSDYFDA